MRVGLPHIPSLIFEWVGWRQKRIPTFRERKIIAVKTIGFSRKSFNRVLPKPLMERFEKSPEKTLYEILMKTSYYFLNIFFIYHNSSFYKIFCYTFFDPSPNFRAFPQIFFRGLQYLNFLIYFSDWKRINKMQGAATICYTQALQE